MEASGRTMENKTIVLIEKSLIDCCSLISQSQSRICCKTEPLSDQGNNVAINSASHRPAHCSIFRLDTFIERTKAASVTWPHRCFKASALLRSSPWGCCFSSAVVL